MKGLKNLSKRFVALSLALVALLSFGTISHAASKTVTCGGKSVSIVHNETYRKANGSTSFVSVGSNCTTSVKVSYKVKNVNNGVINNYSGNKAGTVSASFSYTVPSSSYQVQSSSTYHTYTYKTYSGNCSY